MNDVLIATIIVIVLLIVLIILFSFTVKRVRILLKKIFVDQLQEYDYLITDKEKKVINLDETINKKTKIYAKLEEEVDELEKELENKEEVSSDQVVLPTEADFEDGNILSGYKKIKNGFNFNVEDEIKKFLVDINNNEYEYSIYLKVRNYFSYDVVYKILTYQSEEQRIIVSELLDDEEKKLLDNQLKVKKFNINIFINKLDDLILKNNPKIMVYIGNEKENYNYLNENITTIYDDKITEGFKIIYKGIIYDYSI